MFCSKICLSMHILDRYTLNRKEICYYKHYKPASILANTFRSVKANYVVYQYEAVAYINID